VKLTDEQIGNITNALDGRGEPQPYSGRAMYGESCLGIVTDNPTRAILTLATNLAEMEEMELLALLRDATSREDSMGRSVVIYFPSLTVDDDEEDDEEEC
jgi:hypothetical protein